MRVDPYILIHVTRGGGSRARPLMDIIGSGAHKGRPYIIIVGDDHIDIIENCLWPIGPMARRGRLKIGKFGLFSYFHPNGNIIGSMRQSQ